jgi:glucosylceramidase
VHDAHPDKHLYFTEQWVGAPGNLGPNLAWHVEHLVIGATRNWCRTVLEWNLSSNPELEPHTDRGGCDRCLGAVTIDGDRVSRNPAYYTIAHASKLVRPGSVRVASTMPQASPNVAFRTPAGRLVVVVLNRERTPQTLNLRRNGQVLRTRLPAGAVGTFLW